MINQKKELNPLEVGRVLLILEDVTAFNFSRIGRPQERFKLPSK